MKTLVVYFSRDGENYVDGKIKNLSIGNTQVMADSIAKATKASIFRIETLHPYPKKYQDCTKVALEEQKEKARPAMLDYVHDIHQYDVIYVGFPNWWDTMPMVMFHFFESHNLDGKIIYPFCTHEGSGFGRIINDLKGCCPTAIIKTGLAIRGGEVRKKEAEILAWINDMEVSHEKV